MTLLSKQNFSKGNLQVGLLTVTAMASLCAPITHAAPIYKVVDEQTGQVTFTDRPQSYEQQAGKQVSQTSINTGASTAESKTNTANNVPNTVSNNAPATAVRGSSDLPTAAALPVSNVNYKLSMIEPSASRAYQRPAQNITIALELTPSLQKGDQVSIYFDDKEIAQGLSASIATVDVLPGAHKIRAEVKSASGRTRQQVERTVHVIQNTMILQNKKKLAEQLLAYERLPWHQKVLLKMRGNQATAQ